jgi:hypothetical protein
MVNHMRDRYAKVGSHLAAQIAPYKVAAEFRLRAKLLTWEHKK